MALQESMMKTVYDVTAGDFATAGEVSSTIKQRLKRLGVDAAVIRRIAIASYEAEMNMIIHSWGGQIEMNVDPHYIRMICQDTGPGIEDISLAMKEGYSTAPESVRMMGFGAGMGLPNIKRCSDEFDITSSKESGTRIEAKFNLG